MRQSDLSRPVKIKTDIPYPVIDFEESKTAGVIVLADHVTDKIEIEFASELVNHSVQLSIFRTKDGENSPLDIVHDANGQPMIFSVGSDGASSLNILGAYR